MLRLGAPEEAEGWEPGSPAAVRPGGWSGAVAAAGKEAAGHAFHAAARRLAGCADPAAEGEAAAAAEGEGEAEAEGNYEAQFAAGEEEAKYRGRGKKKKKRRGEDLYALLGLGDQRWLATEKDIKKAYQRTALKAHPDKAGAGKSEAEREAISEKFKAIQAAYETLCDPERRREFDSTDVFDDSLPSDLAGGGDFFAVFGPAFRRQARWSVSKKVPDLGGPDAPIAEVKAFYDFWHKFKSWREFPHEDEEDVECAEDRFHKRWIERFNAKLRAAGKKEESRRLRDFVDAAHAHDPRVARHREVLRAARQAKKDAKRAAYEAQEAEAQRRAEAEEQRREAAAEEARRKKAEDKRAREREKKLHQKQRARFRKLNERLRAAGAAGAPAADEVEAMVAKLSFAALSELNDAVEAGLGDPAASIERIRAVEAARCAAARQAEEEKERAAREAKRVEDERREREKNAAMAAQWDTSELELLEKAMKKFPQGYQRRWEQIAEFVGTHTPEECAYKSKAVLAKQSKAGTGHVIKKKHLANMDIKSPLTLRHESFTDVQFATPEAPELSTPAPAPEPAPWGKEDGLKLIRALKAIPKDAADRWDQVAAQLGRPKVECMREYKKLMAKLKAKQKQAA